MMVSTIPVTRIAAISGILSGLRPGDGVSVEFFIADSRKSGGRYETVCGAVKKIDAFSRLLFLESGMEIPFEDLLNIERI